MALSHEKIKELEEVCFAPFKRSQELLIDAENKLSEKGWLQPGHKSEIRLRFEEFESNVERAWKKAFEEYGVNHVFDLPIPVYRQIAEDRIHKPGVELMCWLSGKAAELKCEAFENPYVMAGAALGMYNLGGKDEDS